MSSKSVVRGKKLEKELEKEAEMYGWKVKKRKKHGRNIQDLILRKGNLVFVVQLKNTDQAGPRDVSQTKKDYEEYINYLVKEELGLKVAPVLVSKSFSEKARKRAKNYGVMLYRLNEFKKLLKK